MTSVGFTLKIHGAIKGFALTYKNNNYGHGKVKTQQDFLK